MTPATVLLLLVTALTHAAVSSAAPDTAASASLGDALYCVEKGADYDPVFGWQIHPGARRCVPGPT